ncbi:MAG: class I SAM-dependent rRNA methyltransferase [Gammaproteobacteria bacterium]|nr:class I SAM-dependent rRNA methyltransferase [Gammaproteobacteria bacterium]
MSDSTKIAPLRLKKNEDRRILAGNPWIFSNEVDIQATPLTAFQSGQNIIIENCMGKPIGTGYVNAHSLICARLISRNPAYPLNKSLLVHRLNIALSLREQFFEQAYYRLVYGESDGLPGLVVDRYGSILVVQIATAGMERVKMDIIDALNKVIKPDAILFRNDVSTRNMEGLENYIETVQGHVPDTIELLENDTRFQTSLLTGQKTGWFYDQRANRSRLSKYIKDKRVLDVFSYIGAWGLQAATHGAKKVTCIDSSQRAIDAIKNNAALNGVSEQVYAMKGDAFDLLKSLKDEQEKFDVIILDPPAFIKRKKDAKEGTLAYQRINQLAMQLLAEDGYLVSASCSYHIDAKTFKNMLLNASKQVHRQLQLLEYGQQNLDHPIHPALAETEYLKTIFMRVIPT